MQWLKISFLMNLENLNWMLQGKGERELPPPWHNSIVPHSYEYMYITDIRSTKNYEINSNPIPNPGDYKQFPKKNVC